MTENEREFSETKVYVVTSGCYSDYSIEAIFSTKENAQLYIDKPSRQSSYYNDIEEFALDEYVNIYKRGYNIYEVEIYKDGEVLKVALIADNVKDIYIHSVLKAKQEDTFKPPSQRMRSVEIVMNVRVQARDESHAIKIANEKRVMLIANGCFYSGYKTAYFGV